MRISELQTSEVVWVAPEKSIDTAITLMEERGIHHLPVVCDGHVEGMLSDRDLLLAVGWKLAVERRMTRSPGKVAGPRRVEQIMSTPVVTITPDDSVAYAARTMVERKIGALPIVKHDRLLGIVTESDLLQWLRLGDLDRSLERMLSEPVRDHMHSTVASVAPEDSLHEVVRLFRERHCRHVPVVEGTILVGMISDRDVRRAMGEASINDAQAQGEGRFYLGPTAARDIMIAPVRTIEPSAALLTAVKCLLSHHIHALPVTEGEELVGILTASDVIGMIARAEEPVASS
ncbi:MAG TPA: CBS domain-containing protein [Phycisphaerae bacterium]|jgi:CBS domain-containing protein